MNYTIECFKFADVQKHMFQFGTFKLPRFQDSNGSEFQNLKIRNCSFPTGMGHACVKQIVFLYFEIYICVDNDLGDVWDLLINSAELQGVKVE